MPGSYSEGLRSNSAKKGIYNLNPACKFDVVSADPSRKNVDATIKAISVLETAFVEATSKSVNVGTAALVGYLNVMPKEVKVGPCVGTIPVIYSHNVTLHTIGCELGSVGVTSDEVDTHRGTTVDGSYADHVNTCNVKCSKGDKSRSAIDVIVLVGVNTE